ncbi:MAG: OB-fold domain-containing protein [Actinomycetota bacterium]|nr:OB-fold domain-containing protein [Actinomycetota bacterium]
MSGKGRIATFTVIPGYQRRAVPMFTWPSDAYPINVIIVELPDADGVHIVSNIVDCDLDELRVGMEVEVVFEDVTDEITLPRFRPVTVGENR